jgi:phosphohistidine phosphatase
MDLFLVRHAIAEDWTPGLPDELRALTAEGRARFASSVRGLGRLGLSFERVLHSPWKRASQTAELLAPVCEGAIVATEALANAPGRELLAALDEMERSDPPTSRVALVGHEPWMSELLAWLSTGSARGAPAVRMRKGALAWMRGAPRPGGMALEALLKPSLLRRLGASPTSPGS